jgi:hypothetical protein
VRAWLLRLSRRPSLLEVPRRARPASAATATPASHQAEPRWIGAASGNFHDMHL